MNVFFFFVWKKIIQVVFTAAAMMGITSHLRESFTLFAPGDSWAAEPLAAVTFAARTFEVRAMTKDFLAARR